MYTLKVISSTVRPGRKGPSVAAWINGLANASGIFQSELLDLGVIDLPLMNEPVHPRLKEYEHAHTKAWSAKIEEADAFVFVTAEYDYSYPASLKNALEYLVHEWAYKPAGLVSYSIGAFAGVRAMSNLRPDLLSMKIVSLNEWVTIPSVNQFITDDGVFVPNEMIRSSADLMITQLRRWTKGMKAIREDK
jgi:NAD(P)H-dependent FMN reductase